MSSRKRHQDAKAVFDKLLDRYEAAEREHRLGPHIAEFVHQSFRDPSKEKRFKDSILHAQRAGAVRLEMDKGDASHLMKRVVLIDAQRLYGVTGRKPKSGKLEDARDALFQFLQTLPQKHRRPASQAAERLLEQWGKNRSPHRLSEDNIQASQEYLLAYGAALSKELTDGRDLRTYSRAECGDSKLIERQLSRIISELRTTETYSADVQDDMILTDLGLEKFPHLVQFAADIPVARAHFEKRRHMGLHPDLIDEIEIPPLRALVTVENFASFNRYVAEVLEPEVAVLYTGGWPGSGEKRMIQILSQHSTEGVFHWGDIDMAGAAIADAVWKVSDAPVKLHQMKPNLARQYGKPQLSKRIRISEDSPAKNLVDWLASESAYTLEQEELDPVPVNFQT